MCITPFCASHALLHVRSNFIVFCLLIQTTVLFVSYHFLHYKHKDKKKSGRHSKKEVVSYRYLIDIVLKGIHEIDCEIIYQSAQRKITRFRFFGGLAIVEGSLCLAFPVYDKFIELLEQLRDFLSEATILTCLPVIGLMKLIVDREELRTKFQH